MNLPVIDNDIHANFLKAVGADQDMSAGEYLPWIQLVKKMSPINGEEVEGQGKASDGEFWLRGDFRLSMTPVAKEGGAEFEALLAGITRYASLFENGQFQYDTFEKGSEAWNNIVAKAKQAKKDGDRDVTARTGGKVLLWIPEKSLFAGFFCYGTAAKVLPSLQPEVGKKFQVESWEQKSRDGKFKWWTPRFIKINEFSYGDEAPTKKQYTDALELFRPDLSNKKTSPDESSVGGKPETLGGKMR